MNLVTVIQQGGIFMIPLLLLSIIALSVALERIFFFSSIEWGGAEFQARLREFIRQGRTGEAVLWLTGLRGAFAGTAAAGLAQWARGKAAVEAAMTTRSHLEFSMLNRNLAVLETIVTASPLIGLLGTITGMMGVFRAVAQKMAESPQADTSGILAGIGEALIATAAGICLAVICLFFHNIFQHMADTQIDATEGLALELLELAEDY